MDAMSEALVAACHAVGLMVKDDAATRLMLTRPDLLEAAAVKSLGPARKH